MECRVAERDNKEHSAKGFIVKLLSNSSVSLINDFCTHTNLEIEELSAMRYWCTNTRLSDGPTLIVTESYHSTTPSLPIFFLTASVSFLVSLIS